MASFDKYFPTLLNLEGGWSNDKDDKGGATKYGVILSEWIANGYDKDNDGDIDVNDLKLITTQDAANIAKRLYWDKLRADKINSQSIAEFIVDWAYNSGTFTASKKLQRAVGADVDGNVGPQTIQLVNSANQRNLFDDLKKMRENFYLAIVENNPTQRRFLKGWLNRNNSFTFKD